MTNKKIVTIDLDSTLCDTRQRWNLVNQEDKSKTDWVAYSLACADDEPLQAQLELVLMLQAFRGVLSMLNSVTPTGAELQLWIVSGRNVEALELTKTWLEKHSIFPDGIALDEKNEGDGLSVADFRESHAQYKLRRIQQVAEIAGGEVVLHIDDWAAIKPLLEENGIPCLVVSPCYGEAPGHSGEGGGAIVAGA